LPGIKYVEKKCWNCKQLYEVRKDYEETSYGHFCPICFDRWAIVYNDGTTEDRSSESIKDTSYKDELQGITHRGKTRV
jgi:rRNA maturation endonuclease Nob1